MFLALKGGLVMFSRRHPYLFFLIIISAFSVVALALVTIMATVLGKSESRFTGEKVGVVEIIGPIVESRKILQDLRTFRESEAIKAILIRVDSPGGGVGPSQEIYREIQKTTEQKKVVISMGAVAASGGYYLAAGADGIVANPGTITGSIGVIMGYTNFEELMQKIGLSAVVIKSGEYKDTGSPTRPMSADERQILQEVSYQIHRQFVEAIAEGRRLNIKQVEALADGRIFTGQNALELGLVDRLGNFEDAIAWAGELGGIQGKVETVYPAKERLSLIDYVMESTLHLWQNRLQSWKVPQLRIP
jgi:protease-4